MANKNTLSTLSVCVQGGIRRDKLEGKDYLVAPVIAMTEGVRNGPQGGGPSLYLASEYGKFPSAWDGIPLPIWHPEDGEGHYISANSPDIIESQSVGWLYNSHMDDGKLKGELWICIEKAKRIAPVVLETLEGGGRLEISVSLFSEEEPNSGNFNGTHYDTIARNMRPDHLALLPGGKGACSWEGGCGAPRVNTEQGGGDKMEPDQSLAEKIKAPFILLAKELGMKFQEVSHEKTRGELQIAIDAMDTTEKVDSPVQHYVTAVFDKYFVYEQMSQDGLKLFKQNYKKQKNDSIKLEGKPQEVKADTSYKAVKANQQGGEETMEKIKELASGLIANALTTFTESDREFLEGLNECQLTKMAPVVNEVAKPCGDAVKSLIGNEDSPFAEKDAGLLSNMSKEQFDAIAGKYPEKKEEVKANAEPKEKTYDELLAAASPETQEIIANGVKMHREQKEKVVAGLIANKRCEFTDEQLKAKPLDELKTLAKLAQVDVDFSGQASSPAAQEKKVEPLALPTVEGMAKK